MNSDISQAELAQEALDRLNLDDDAVTASVVSYDGSSAANSAYARSEIDECMARGAEALQKEIRDAEARRLAEEEARRKAAEEEEARRRAEDERRRKALEDEKARLAKISAEQARRRAEDERRRKALED